MGRIGIDVNFIVNAECADVASRTEGRLKELGLQGAWVTARASRTQEPEAFDGLLREACSQAPSLHPVPVVLPPVSSPGGFERAKRLATANPCRVLRVCPGAHGYPLVPWVLSPLPELCEREGLTLVLDFDPGPVKWVESVEFARAFPAVPMVVLAVSIGDDLAAPAALDAAPNLILQVARLKSIDDLSRLAGTYGAHRFVWGSSGFGDAASPHADLVEASALDDEARAAILYRNALSLAAGSYAEALL